MLTKQLEAASISSRQVSSKGKEGSYFKDELHNWHVLAGTRSLVLTIYGKNGSA